MSYILIILIYSASGPFALPVDSVYSSLVNCKNAGGEARRNEKTQYPDKYVGYTCVPHAANTLW